jgi:acetyl-CoA carboxylase biotin carboxyl carrier protein
VDLRKLKTLIDLVSESSISELEITEAEGKVRIVKAVPSGPAAVSHIYAPPGGAAQGPVAAGTPASAPSAVQASPAAAAAPSEPVAEVRTIKSPMVGTFYRSASPGAAAFVDVGSEVKVGQAVCIVEAMKIMNEIESEEAGRIVKVLCENGQAVEFGQPLFVLG